jgi:hypothetical protein
VPWFSSLWKNNNVGRDGIRSRCKLFGSGSVSYFEVYCSDDSMVPEAMEQTNKKGGIDKEIGAICAASVYA